MNKTILCIASFLGVAMTTYAQETNTKDSVNMESLTQSIPEVMVKGRRPVVKVERGKLNYNMPALLKQLPADNAYEALLRIPGVSDATGNVTFSGRGVTLILNGQPTTLSQEQLEEKLKTLPAAALAKAEVMMATPPNLHVRGMAINIVTKDLAGTTQLSGQLGASWQQDKYGKGSTKGALTWQKGKWGMDMQYAFTNGNSYMEVTHEAQHPLNGQRVPYSDFTENRTLDISHDYHVGMNYAFSKTHRIELSYTGNWNSSKSYNHTTGDSQSNQRTGEHIYMNNVDLNYTLPFGLRLSGSFIDYRNPRNQLLDGEILHTEQDITTHSNQKIKTWMFAADQSHTLGKGWGLNYGVKGQLTKEYSYQTATGKDGKPIEASSSRIDTDERIWNFYAGFSKQLTEKFSLDASVAGELYHSPVWEKWRVYPTFNALWTINNDHLLNLSFSADSKFPSYWSKMSSVNYSSPYSEIWGNPGLRPSSSYDVNLVWQLKQRYTFVAFVSARPNYFVQLPYQTSDRMAVIMKETNFDYSTQAGLQASATFNAGFWLSGNVSATGLYQHEKSSHFFDLPFDRKHLSCVLSGTAAVKFSQKHDLRLILNPFFQSQAIQGVYDIQSLFQLNASLRWTSPNSHWSVKIDGSNLTNARIHTNAVQGNQDYRMRVGQNWVTCTLGIVYRFGGYKEAKSKKVDTSRMGY